MLKIFEEYTVEAIFDIRAVRGFLRVFLIYKAPQPEKARQLLPRPSFGLIARVGRCIAHQHAVFWGAPQRAASLFLGVKFGKMVRISVLADALVGYSAGGVARFLRQKNGTKDGVMVLARRVLQRPNRLLSPCDIAENDVQCREEGEEAGAYPPIFQGGHQVLAGHDEAR
jgi:hypothetical protein